MRWLLVVLLLVVGSPAALAKPSVAIAPIQGDAGDRIGGVIAEVLADDADVSGPTATGKAMAKLDLAGELTVKAKKQLFKRMGVEALVEGKLGKAGKQKQLELELTAKGKKSVKFTLQFKSAASDRFRDDVRTEILKRLGDGTAAPDEPDDTKRDRDAADADKRDRKRDRDDARRDRKRDRDRDRDEPARDRVAEGDDEDGKVTKRKGKKRRGGDEGERDDDDDDGDDGDDGDREPAARHAVTQVALRVSVGGGFGMRTLTYGATGDNVPPRVGTPNASARVEGELYPLGFDQVGGAGGLGLYGDYDKTLGLSIAVPGAMGGRAAIDQSHFSIGARYRVPIGMHSLAFGAAYAKRKFIVDRSGAGAMLDVPDVDYAALAPGAVLRIGAGPKVGISLGANALLVLDAGPIASKGQYGSGSVIAFEVDAGVDLALGKSYALRFAGELTQIGISFNGKGAMSARGVETATDRSLGASATFAVTY